VYFEIIIELDDGKIYRKPLYLMVKIHGFPEDFPPPVIQPDPAGKAIAQNAQPLLAKAGAAWPGALGALGAVACFPRNPLRGYLWKNLSHISHTTFIKV